MPLLIALWLPLMRGRLMNPAEQPISAPPGKVSLGTDCTPPSLMAREPYTSRLPPCRYLATSGWVLKRWNSSNGERYGFSYERCTTKPSDTRLSPKWYMNEPPCVSVSDSGQPCECATRPFLKRVGSTCHNSFSPIPHFCGSMPARRSNLAI